MRHARTDYDRIQDPDNKIPDNEPVLLFRGQDKHSLAIAYEYLRLLEESGGQPEMKRALQKQIKRIEAWQKTVKCKEPDMPKDAVLEF